MSWQNVLGHQRHVERFRRAAERSRLAGSYLFVGPEGIGKRTFAVELAKTLLCEGRTPERFEACDTCPACQQVAAGSHPDLITVEKPKDKNFIPIELLIGDRDHRGREGLCHDISLTPYRGGRKVAIVDDADYFNVEGANCLLKTLEEPPPEAVIVLIGTTAQRQLPTIRSRTQEIHFQPLAEQHVQRLLVEQRLASSGQQAADLARRSRGSIAGALRSADEGVRDLEATVQAFASTPGPDPVAFAQAALELVEAAGKDASSKRQRAKLMLEAALDQYRGQLVSASGDRGEVLCRRIDRCLDALRSVDANVNLRVLLDAVADDLAQA